MYNVFLKHTCFYNSYASTFFGVCATPTIVGSVVKSHHVSSVSAVPTLVACIEQWATVARYNLARLVAARHAIWRLRRTGSQPCPDHHTDTDSYVPTNIILSSSTAAAIYFFLRHCFSEGLLMPALLYLCL